MPDRQAGGSPGRRAARRRVSHTGPVRGAQSASAGSVSNIAATLETASGPVFLQGHPDGQPAGPDAPHRGRVNPWLPDVAPRMRWKVEEAGWLVLGFDHVPGRHAVLSPDSADLPVIADALTALAQGLTPCPPVRVQAATKRWEGRIDPEMVDGDTLVHTDVTPFNFLLGARVRVIDWSMPCRGAAWIDTALMIVRLIRAGHGPDGAEGWADQIPVWKQADPPAIEAFAAALADLWEQRRHENPAPHRGPLAVAADPGPTTGIRPHHESDGLCLCDHRCQSFEAAEATRSRPRTPERSLDWELSQRQASRTARTSPNTDPGRHRGGGLGRWRGPGSTPATRRAGWTPTRVPSRRSVRW